MMEVKRFQAPTMKEALEAVKRELGEDAVILKSEKVPRSGFFDLMKGDMVEVVAAVDDGERRGKMASDVPAQGGRLAYFQDKQRAMKPASGASGRDFGVILERSMQPRSGRNTKTTSTPQRSKGTSRKPRSGPVKQVRTGSGIQGASDRRSSKPRAVSGRKGSGRIAASRGSAGRGAVQRTSRSSNQPSASLQRSQKTADQSRATGVRKPVKASRSAMKTVDEMSWATNLLGRSGYGSEADLQKIQKEMQELRSTLSNIASRIELKSEPSLREFADMPATLAREYMNLVESGVESHVARDLIEKASKAHPVDDIYHAELLKEHVRQEMMNMIRTSGPIACQKGKPKVIALVGPTGVGKTTTLAKLAANSKFVFEKRVSLISADTYRMSAIEHLNTFAGIAHLPLSAVYSPVELNSALTANKDKDLIFIDTAGRSPRDAKHLEELKIFMECAQPDEIHLVIPANMKNMDLLDTVQRFSVLPINRVVVSKVDETSTLGTIVNIAAEVACPISYITNGQTIPDDIELANSRNLADTIMHAA